MRAQGLEPTSRLLEVGYVSADDDLADLLRIRQGARVLRIERLRLANGEPMAIEATHLCAKRFPGLRRHLAKYSSLYSALSAEYGVHLAEAEETIETALATPREAGCWAPTPACRCCCCPGTRSTRTASRWSGCARSTAGTGTSSSPG